MEKTLMTQFDCSDILDNAVRDIFSRVARLAVKPTDAPPMDTRRLYSLVISTSGDYHLTIVLCAENTVFMKICEHMKRGALPAAADIPIYVSEFFNILCGHIVSNLNRQYKCSARFSVPSYVKGYYIIPKEEQQRDLYFYNSGYGIIQIETLLFL